jgi:hypothetical protein
MVYGEFWKLISCKHTEKNMPLFSEKYLQILKELIYEYQMEKLADDPKVINQAYQMLLKHGALSETALIRKFKITSVCASKLMQRFKDQELIDKFGRMIDQVSNATK